MWCESQDRSREDEDRRVLGPGPGRSHHPPPASVPSTLGAFRGGGESRVGAAVRGGGQPRCVSAPRGPLAASGSVLCWGRRHGVRWGLGPQRFLFGRDPLSALTPWPAGRPGKPGVSWSPAGRTPRNDKHDVGTRYTRVKGLHRALHGGATSGFFQPRKVTSGRRRRPQANSSWHKASLVAVPSQPFSGLGALPSPSRGGRRDAAFQGASHGRSAHGARSPGAGRRSLVPCWPSFQSEVRRSAAAPSGHRHCVTQLAASLRVTATQPGIHYLIGLALLKPPGRRARESQTGRRTDNLTHGPSCPKARAAGSELPALNSQCPVAKGEAGGRPAGGPHASS